MKFPRQLYVRIEEGGGRDEDYFVPADDLDSHAVIGEKIKIGVYELKEVVTLEAKVQWQRVAQ